MVTNEVGYAGPGSWKLVMSRHESGSAGLVGRVLVVVAVAAVYASPEAITGEQKVCS